MSVGKGNGPPELLDGDGRGDCGALELGDAAAGLAGEATRCRAVGVGLGVGVGVGVVRLAARAARLWPGRTRAVAAVERPGAAAGPATPSCRRCDGTFRM